MNKKFILCLILCVAILSSLTTVSGWGPSAHSAFNRELLNNPLNQDSDIVIVAKANADYFYGCTMIPDAGVFYYYVEGGKNYKALHNNDFANCVLAKAETPQDLACAYGIVSHHVADDVAHNQYIPKMIRTYKLSNEFVHPPAELLIDSDFVDENPEDLAKIRQGMDVVAADTELMNSMQSCLQSAQGIDFDLPKHFGLLRSSINTGTSFFTTSFKVPDYYYQLSTGNVTGGLLFFFAGLLFLLGRIFKKKIEWLKYFGWMPYILSAIFILLGVLLLTGGISTYASAAVASQEVEITNQRMSQIFTEGGWGLRGTLDPTGFDAIGTAEQEVRGQTILIYGLVIFALMLLLTLWTFRIYYKFKNR